MALLEQRVLPFFPLMPLAETNLNGWLPTVPVAFKPRRVYSFSDDQYIHGKWRPIPGPRRWRIESAIRT